MQLKVTQPKMTLAPVKTVLVVPTEDYRWWADRLNDAHFTFAKEMARATLIILPPVGYNRFEALIPQTLRPRTIVIQDSANPFSGQAVQKLRDLGFAKIYFGRQQNDEFVSFVAKELNGMN